MHTAGQIILQVTEPPKQTQVQASNIIDVDIPVLVQ